MHRFISFLNAFQDRIFNNAYHSSPPSERVKYGVLNIGWCHNTGHYSYIP